jgi:hypothetical protein
MVGMARSVATSLPSKPCLSEAAAFLVVLRYVAYLRVQPVSREFEAYA